MLLCQSPVAGAAQTELRSVANQLNNQPVQRVSASRQSYRAILDAYLDMTQPPVPITRDFDVTSIYPGGPNWEKFAQWAGANQVMAKALEDSRSALSFGLPYGVEGVDKKYVDAGLVARAGAGGDLRNVDFPYFKAVYTVAAFGVADMYRLAEEGQYAEAFRLAASLDRFLRTMCDRLMLEEKTRFMTLLSDVLSVQRDAMYTYRQKIPTSVLTEFAKEELPFLRPDRKRLEMPEGERIISEALLAAVFDDRGQADPEKFAEVFGQLQSAGAPLTRFGAAKRWKRIADVHGSLDASQKKLIAIYDDWWRRWRMREYDAMQSLPTEFSRTNPIRYGGVIYSIQDIASLFELRKRLIAEVNAAAMTAGLLGYWNDYATLPDDVEKAYTVHMLKRSDFDPWDRRYGTFLFRWLGSQRQAVDTPNGRVWVDGIVVYARGRNHEDDRFQEHTPDGAFGDMIVFPPIRAIEREQGVVQ